MKRPTTHPVAFAWWRGLSINEQNQFAKKHFPALSMDLIIAGKSWIEDIYQAETGQSLNDSPSNPQQ